LVGWNDSDPAGTAPAWRRAGAEQSRNSILTAMEKSQFCGNYPESYRITGQENQIVLDYFTGSGATGHAVIDQNREDHDKKNISAEMGAYFDTALQRRVVTVMNSDRWKDGRHTARHTGISHCFAYIRPESCEDTLNNLRLAPPHHRKKDAANPDNGQRKRVFVVWRKPNDDIAKDKLMLDECFQKNRISARDCEFDTIYDNCSNTLSNLKLDDENWKVRLIEEEFMTKMWEAQY
jgi:hypothetical protein